MTPPNHPPPWIRVVTRQPVQVFLTRVVSHQEPIDHLVLVSPFIGPLKGISPSLTRLVDKINRDKIRTYVITNEPSPNHSPSQQAAVDVLTGSRYTEIRYNASLHAKVYVCKAQRKSFAMLGSGNLTETSIARRIEVGVVVFDQDQGMYLFRELWKWGSQNLRQRKESRLIKAIK